MQPGSRNPAEDSRIESWKAIAAYFGRDERTVKRWEKTRGLPIHRLPGEKGGVFAYSRELAVWLNSSSPEIAETVVPDAPSFGRRSSDVQGPLTRETATVVLEEPTVEVEAPPDASDIADNGLLAEVEVANRPERRRRTVLFSAMALAAMLLLGVSLAKFLYARHAIGMQPAVGQGARISSRPVDPAAQEAYLKGRYYWNHRTDGSLREAVDAFTQAVVRDPNYAPAYAGLADSYNLMPQFSSMPRSQAFPLALAAARKAVALDDSLSEAHRALAFGLFYWEWDINGASREFERAIALDPKDVDAHNWFATSLLLAHRDQAALVEVEKARELDPTSRVVLVNQAFILYWSGDHDQGAARLRQLERDEPEFLSPPLYLARVYFFERNYPAYMAELKRAAELSRDPQKADLAAAAERGWAHGGERGLLEQLRDYYRHSFESGQSSGYDIAHICALLDQKSDADRYLQAAVDAHDFEAMSVFHGEFNTRMEGDPGFEKIKQEIKTRMSGSQTASAGQ